MMKLPVQSIKKVAVFRALQLGDLLCSIPAIRALRAALPHAEITLIGLPWAQSLLTRFPSYFNQFISFPGYPGLPEQSVDIQGTLSLLKRMNEDPFDLVLQMQGDGTIVNPMVMLWNAHITAGFCKEGDYCPDNGYFLEYPDRVPEIDRHLLLMEYLGISPQGRYLEFPLSLQDEEQLRDLGLPISPRQYACIHPGSRGSWRQWPPEYFARMADRCASHGLQVVITGSREEKSLADEVMRYMQYPAINTAGATTLGAVGALLKDAALLVSNCTGVSHLASALQTRSVIISMDGEPDRWGALNRELHTTIDWTVRRDVQEVQRALDRFLN